LLLWAQWPEDGDDQLLAARLVGWQSAAAMAQHVAQQQMWAVPCWQLM